MSRKIRTPKGRSDVPLSPAWLFTLMSGQLSGGVQESARRQGWSEQANDAVKLPNGTYDYNPKGDALWLLHAEALVEEAARHDFEPFWASKQPPHGAGFEQWQDAFLRANRY